MLLQVSVLLLYVINVCTHVLQPLVQAINSDLLRLILVEHGVHVAFHFSDSLIHRLSFIFVRLLQLLNLLQVHLNLGPFFGLFPDYLLCELRLKQLLFSLDRCELALIPLNLSQ